MNNTLISVIIPVYKVEQFLERCVRSVICQTYKNLEIILVDDGSPDSCGDICELLAKEDERVVVLHKENGGLSDARNYGVERSHGAYIAFVDSDDYVSENYIEYLYGLAVENEADISCCCRVKTENDCADFGVEKEIGTQVSFTNYSACKELLHGKLYGVLVTAWAKLYKAELVKKYPFPVGRKYEDEATTFKYYYNSNKVVLGNRQLYAYYQNPESITHNKGTDLNQDVLWVFKHRAEFFEALNEKELSARAWRMLFKYYINDSQKYNGRCDELLRTYRDDGKTLSSETVFELRLYNLSHKLFSFYRSIRSIAAIVKNKLIKIIRRQKI